MALFFGTLRETFYSTFGCCLPTPLMHINGRTLKVIKLLGEGGFSMVYLVEDPVTQRLFAVKKVHCPVNAIGRDDNAQEAVRQAVREAEMTRLFDHPNIIKVLDVCVTQERSGQGKTVHLFLPYYKRGTLHDVLAEQRQKGEYLTERQILRMFRNICHAVRELHCHDLPDIPARHQRDSASPRNGVDAYGRGINYSGSTANSRPANAMAADEADADEDDEERAKERAADRRVVYAHRDIKPGNILIEDDGATPILMDFGSIDRAKIVIRNRQQALKEQDRAAEQCSMAYRAPELFDVKTGSTLDERVDIWSLGCLLYAMAYGESPFDAAVNEPGGSVAMAVQSGKYHFPTDNKNYSENFQTLIQSLLVTDPAQRPDIQKTIELVEAQMEYIGM